jgi:hypothetical protein
MPNIALPSTTLLSMNSKHTFQDEIRKPNITKNGLYPAPEQRNHTNRKMEEGSFTQKVLHRRM